MVAPPSLGKRLIGAVTGGLAGKQVAETLAQGMLSNMPWRKANAKYTQNEIYFDIVEEIDCIIGENGRPISVDVHGSIQVNCRLSGVPDLELTFEDPSMMSDPSFHPCVRLKRFEQDHTVSFVPPDGCFELMTYRAKKNFDQVPCPIYCKPQIGFGRQRDFSDVQTPMRVQLESPWLPITGLAGLSVDARVDVQRRPVASASPSLAEQQYADYRGEGRLVLVRQKEPPGYCKAETKAATRLL